MNASTNPRIQRAVNSLLGDGILASAVHMSSVDSTNTEANRWVQKRNTISSEAPGLPCLIIADEQTAGRGRMGRSWNAQNDGLAFSMIWPSCGELTSIAVGVAIAEAIEFLVGPTKCGLKWPNDVWISGRKVAGVLIERIENAEAGGRPFAIVGIGLNVGSSPSLPEPLAVAGVSATSLVEATGKPITNADVLSELIPILASRLNDVDHNPSELIANFQHRCVLTSHPVRCVINGEAVEGICGGIDISGELILNTARGMKRCRSGEVSQVRPR